MIEGTHNLSYEVVECLRDSASEYTCDKGLSFNTAYRKAVDYKKKYPNCIYKVVLVERIIKETI